mmetsp:Transcript_27942/g.50871  ORF Transcript_27942/g.50871 Transcript_27942/m.50871 type:complete len:657 (-) Transcript_27942:1331-3301(-)
MIYGSLLQMPILSRAVMVIALLLGLFSCSSQCVTGFSVAPQVTKHVRPVRAWNCNQGLVTSSSSLLEAIGSTTTDLPLFQDEESSEPDLVNEVEASEHILHDDSMTVLPRHPTHEGLNAILETTEHVMAALHVQSLDLQQEQTLLNTNKIPVDDTDEQDVEDPLLNSHERVFSNSYVDLGKVSTVGFDYDYTLVTYNQELLELIYNMALERLVTDNQYPLEMLDAGLKFDPRFSIRGLAVDRKTGWICHLSYTHKVAVAWEGRNKVSSSRLVSEYSGKRAMRPQERKKRLKPLNDLFSMAECCLIADTVHFFKTRKIPFYPPNVVNDVLKSVGSTHISGDFHRLVAKNPSKYFHPTPHLKQVLDTLKSSGKRLIFVSNSPFWYVDAGMKHVIGTNWRDTWDVVIVSAGKPNFYTDEARPFREVSHTTSRVKFKKVTKLEPGEVYTEGCLKEMIKCLDWYHPSESQPTNNLQSQSAAGVNLASPNVLYVGDSLFADLVDAKREFGWTTAAVAPEVGWEIEIQSKAQFLLSQRTIDLLLHTLRKVQRELGNGLRTEDDLQILDSLERLVSRWRDEQSNLLGNPFGSVFRARFQPSLFAHSLRRYCDLYMNSVSSLRHYSPQHRFYPDDARLLSHETTGTDQECWELDRSLDNIDVHNL